MAYPINWTCPACGSIINNSNSCNVCNYSPPAESGLLEAAKKSERLIKERALAFLIDMLVLNLIIGIAAYIFIATQATGEQLIRAVNVMLLPALLIGLAAHPFYLLALELMLKGRTYGKAIMKIRVVKLDGSRAGFAGLLIRNMMRFFEALTLYIISFYYINKSTSSQRLGDKIAGTMVVKV